MKKIISQKEHLKARRQLLSEMIICSTPKKSDHCLNKCFHGKPHTKEIERDAFCHTKQAFCSLSKAGIIKVKCKRLTKQQIEENL
jgi:hypothetical protein